MASMVLGLPMAGRVPERGEERKAGEQAGSGTNPLNMFVSGLDIYSSGNLGLTTSGIGLLQIGSGTNPFNLRIRGK